MGDNTHCVFEIEAGNYNMHLSREHARNAHVNVNGTQRASEGGKVHSSWKGNEGEVTSGGKAPEGHGLLCFALGILLRAVLLDFSLDVCFVCHTFTSTCKLF